MEKIQKVKKEWETNNLIKENNPTFDIRNIDDKVDIQKGNNPNQQKRRY